MYLRQGEGDLKEERRKVSLSWLAGWPPASSTLPGAEEGSAVLLLLGGPGNLSGTAGVQAPWPFHPTTKFKPCEEESGSSLPLTGMAWGRVH